MFRANTDTFPLQPPDQPSECIESSVHHNERECDHAHQSEQIECQFAKICNEFSHAFAL